MKAYACVDLNEEEKQLFDLEWVEDIYDADIILGNPKQFDINPKFIQLESAGYEQYRNKFSCPVCSASGSFGLGISEYLICTILMMMRHMKKYMHQQEQCTWDRFDDTIRSIDGSTILILGLGNLGQTFAQKIQSLGAYTIGIRRNVVETKGINEVHPMKDLNPLLKRADVIVNCLPASEQTNDLLTIDHFKNMKSSAIFCNVGRGSLVKTSVLEAVMIKNIIEGMILDVVEEEPLYKESILWKHPNVIITPHVSGTFQLEQAKQIFLAIAKENIQSFSEGKPLKNLIEQ